MINFHVTKLAKGRHKNICEWIYIHTQYILCILYTELVRFHSCFILFCFLRRFSFIHLAIICFCSTSLLIIWLVGFDHNQCQSSVCIFNEFFAFGSFLHNKWVCQNICVCVYVWLCKNVCTCFKEQLFFLPFSEHLAHPNKFMLQLRRISIIFFWRNKKNTMRLNDEIGAGGIPERKAHHGNQISHIMLCFWY